jgi:hypothetical protein
MYLKCGRTPPAQLDFRHPDPQIANANGEEEEETLGEGRV